MTRFQHLSFTAILFWINGCGAGQDPQLVVDSRFEFTVEDSRPAHQTREIILQAFHRIAGSNGLKNRYRMVYKMDSPLFPSDDAFVGVQPSDVSRPEPRPLQDWLKILRLDRKLDLYVVPNEDFYWESDYRLNKKPVAFSAEFILNFVSIGESKTKIYLIQKGAHIRAGKKFDLLGRTGPGRYWDIRPVAPSPRAATELAAFLKAALAVH